MLQRHFCRDAERQELPAVAISPLKRIGAQTRQFLLNKISQLEGSYAARMLSSAQRLGGGDGGSLCVRHS